MLIHRHRALGRSMCCEASRILTVYDEIHRMNFADPNITLLDPDLFKSSYCYSLAEQTTFHNKVGGWIDNIGHGIRKYQETWMIQELLVDYKRLELSLRLVKGFERIVYSCPPRRAVMILQQKRCNWRWVSNNVVEGSPDLNHHSDTRPPVLIYCFPHQKFSIELWWRISSSATIGWKNNVTQMISAPSLCGVSEGVVSCHIT